ncbi:hypothetical protein [Candidatus Hydrogenosomobacter endosymbioticus]|uniref:Uncharacterized protein n=1 Tax=Candidatus Hydrogenosomobacter endosymbioticus TaxID=2558174 RepID=A0ABM7V8G1_9PROT|nr:hypothetical protein [Candidatus Hydrogenosomobacter endosymbioticus]BDB96075.1 hypothetical protein HYD_2080 [Candidatus Hydrogenosomobacter endosymbioticus]
MFSYNRTALILFGVFLAFANANAGKAQDEFNELVKKINHLKNKHQAKINNLTILRQNRDALKAKISFIAPQTHQIAAKIREIDAQIGEKWKLWEKMTEGSEKEKFKQETNLIVRQMNHLRTVELKEKANECENLSGQIKKLNAEEIELVNSANKTKDKLDEIMADYPIYKQKAEKEREEEIEAIIETSDKNHELYLENERRIKEEHDLKHQQWQAQQREKKAEEKARKEERKQQQQMAEMQAQMQQQMKNMQIQQQKQYAQEKAQEKAINDIVNSYMEKYRNLKCTADRYVNDIQTRRNMFPHRDKDLTTQIMYLNNVDKELYRKTGQGIPNHYKIVQYYQDVLNDY